ncbi:hypothetical protein HYT26_04830 [Candidatus Pacearchaeota archaeon]|nr:hypothetical protein [Candidatus Pacearchaeota archaeon]
MRPTKDMLYNVITNTILLDNLLDEIIRNSFGLEIEWDNESNSIINSLIIERFDRFFLQDMGASSKMNLLKEIIKEDYEEKITLPKDFDNKVIRFYKIRNIFAHSLYPKHVDKREMPNLLPNNATWEDLHKEHSNIFKEINNFLIKNLYIKITTSNGSIKFLK